MADEVKSASTDSTPLAPIPADPPKPLVTPPPPAVTTPTDPSPTDLTAAQKLRAFEDEHLGKDAVRIDGDLERGAGSRFQAMTDDQRAQHKALENLVAAEKKMADAIAALATAQAAHDAAALQFDTVTKAAADKQDKETNAPEAVQ